MSGIPEVIGCIGGSHIADRCPVSKASKSYVNRYDMISMTVQGIYDNKRRFLDVSTGYPCEINHGGVFKLSIVSKRLPLCDGARYHLLGGAAYACRDHLVTPHKNYLTLTGYQLSFNTRLSSTRVLIESALEAQVQPAEGS